MNPSDQEHIEVEAFDREYPIEELLPLSMLETIGSGSTAILPAQWAILTDKRDVHFRVGPWGEIKPDPLTDDVIINASESETIVYDTAGGLIMFFPITYELELKGYLAVCDPGRSRESLTKIGCAGINLFNQLIRLKHQTMLTSSLHGLVVEESYVELKEKARQLALSEEKYRKLSANLEFEVQKKTDEIRKAHAHLMRHEKMAAIGQLSAGMAHEINNPLGFILSNLTTLKSYTDDFKTLIRHYQHLVTLCNKMTATGALSSINAQCEVIKEIEASLDLDYLLTDIPALVEESSAGAERIQKIVRDLKAVARPGETQQELINIHESINAVLTIVQNRISPKIEILRIFGPVPLICGYPQEISQIWLNLILNALDALENQGTLSITTQVARNQVVVGIEDTGSGIAQDDLPKVFDPFFTTKDVGKGTGLGLHLVYQLITKHGGRIELESQLDQGCTVTVHFPVNKA
jgi:two-component system, NtrC family, sensor kinase